jgi:hypothetical protein
LPKDHPLSKSLPALLPLHKLAAEPFVMYSDRTFLGMNEMLIQYCLTASSPFAAFASHRRVMFRRRR